MSFEVAGDAYDRLIGRLRHTRERGAESTRLAALAFSYYRHGSIHCPMQTLSGSGGHGSILLRRLLNPHGLGRIAVLWLAMTVVVGSAELWLYGELPAPAESLVVMPVALCAFAYGLRGGVLAASVALALNTSAFLVDHLAAAVDFAAHSATFVLVGCTAGWLVDRRQALVTEAERREQLSLDLVATASNDGWFLSVNPAFTRLLGYSVEEMLSRPFVEFIHPDDRATTLTNLAEQAETGRALFGVLNRFRVKDGSPAPHLSPDHISSYRHLEWNVRVDEQLKTLIWFGRDVTDRVQVEEQEELKARELALALGDARETNVRLNLVAEAVLDGLITVDADGTILRFNESAERIFGYRREEAIGMNAGVLTVGNGQESYVARYVRTGEEGFVGARREVLGRRKDGSVFPMELAIKEVSRGGERDFIGIVRDITERKQQEDDERHHKETLELTVQERTSALQRTTDELEEAKREILRRLGLAAEHRDDETYEHTERVGRTAALLAAKLGLEEQEVALIRQAAPLHDVGKLGVPDAILLKVGELSTAEWERMKQHTLDGAAILSGSRSAVLNKAMEIALSHHEWWDGSGYPAGLAGEQIPLSGRILALADVYDALTHNRPYKRAWPIEQALAEIHSLRGRQFDPAIVDAFDQLDPHQLGDGSPAEPPAQVIRETSGNGAPLAARVARSGSPDEEPTESVASVAKHAGAKENGASPDMGDDRFRRLVERSNDLIFLLDLEGIVMSANPAVERLTGFRSEETVGTNFLEYLAPAHLERAGTLFARLMAGADVVSEELELVAKDGQPVFLDVSARPIVEGGQLVGVEGIARDVTERRALLDALTYQSLHDPLTGLPNRTLFGDRLAHALALSQRDSSTVALMLLDLDNFKLINDSLGHGVGDKVLVAVASRLERELRESESVMRLGGDEFAVIVEDATNESESAAVATRILAALTELLAVDDRVGQITASLGIALSQPNDDAASLLCKADIAMYQTKAEHPGQFRFYHPETPEFPQPRNARPSPVSRR